MKKFSLILLLIIFSTLISGVYGIIHDQITFTISEEYFTKFKFFQFNLDTNFWNRFGVGIIGFLATWWVGLIGGTILSIVGLIHKERKQIFSNTFKAILLTFVFVIFTPIILICIWFINYYYFTSFNNQTFAINLPDFVPANIKVNNTINFYIVGIIHNASYLGGIIGLISGIIYQFYKYKRFKRINTSVI